jgi:hypothetical protein
VNVGHASVELFCLWISYHGERDARNTPLASLCGAVHIKHCVGEVALEVAVLRRSEALEGGT